MAANTAQIKAGRYQRLREQLALELAKCDDPVARMATTAAVLHAKQPHFFWTGFYRLVDGRLIVGPYQGSLACQVIEIGAGVCGTAFHRHRTIVVPDVHQFPGHIACDARSASEIVVPYTSPDGQQRGVLDVDALDLDAFDDVDAEHLEAVVALVFA
jgi:GAF domain-containing protein